jgi:ATP-binding cassette subfamily B protein
MNYDLKPAEQNSAKTSTWQGLRKLLQLIAHEKRTLIIALISIVINSALNLLGPLIIGHTIDNYVQHKDFDGVLHNAAIYYWACIPLALFTSYKQTTLMGGVVSACYLPYVTAIFNKLLQFR